MEKIRANEANTEQNGTNGWDMSEFLEKPTALEEVKTWSEEYRTTERQFAEYARGLGNQNGEGYKKSLLAYEDDLAHDFKLLDEATQVAMNEREIADVYEMAKVQNLDAVKPEETVEAASGIFFDERMKALYQKINGMEDEEKKKADLEFARGTWRAVLNYIEASNDYEAMHGDYYAYQRNRQGAHNGMIRQLNGLNEMAERYDCKRFTVRNFMTNDFNYSVRRDPTRHLDRRAQYDRETVLSYFRTVFARDFTVAKNKSDRYFNLSA